MAEFVMYDFTWFLGYFLKLLQDIGIFYRNSSAVFILKKKNTVCIDSCFVM